MPPVSDWLDMMPVEVTHEEFASRDAYGVPSYGSEATYRARISYKPTRVRASDGAEHVATATVWFAEKGMTLTVEDRITLPDGKTPQILSVEPVHDEKGLHHVKVYLG